MTIPFTFNTTGGDEPKKELLEKGTYTFSVLGVFDKKYESDDELITDDGVKYVNVTCVEKETGLRVTHKIFFDPNKTAKVYYWLKAIGKEPEGESVEIDYNDWVGCNFRGEVIQKEWQGRTFNRIQIVHPFCGDAPEEPIESIEEDVRDPDLDEDIPF